MYLNIKFGPYNFCFSFFTLALKHMPFMVPKEQYTLIMSTRKEDLKCIYDENNIVYSPKGVYEIMRMNKNTK